MILCLPVRSSNKLTPRFASIPHRRVPITADSLYEQRAGIVRRNGLRATGQIELLSTLPYLANCHYTEQIYRGSHMEDFLYRHLFILSLLQIPNLARLSQFLRICVWNFGKWRYLEKFRIRRTKTISLPSSSQRGSHLVPSCYAGPVPISNFTHTIELQTTQVSPRRFPTPQSSWWISNLNSDNMNFEKFRGVC